MFSQLSLLALVAVLAVHVNAVDKARLRFKISATNLPDKDTGFNTIDPYVEVFYTEQGSSSATKIGKTSTINNNQNPEWSNVFEFDFDRSRNQKWNFKIWDHDVGAEDDKGGSTWVDVADYVDKGELTTANLDKKGYLTVRSASPQQTYHGGASNPGQLPLPPGTPDNFNIKFKLSANGISAKDDVGFIQGSSDPYAEIFAADGLTGKLTKIGRTGTLHDTRDPTWGETFTYAFDRRKDQRLQVKIWDHDNLREDDKAGLAWISLNDYVSHGQDLTVNLNKKGSLTITRADGQPINPYTPQGNSGSFNNNHHQPGFVQPGSVVQPTSPPIHRGTVPVVTPPSNLNNRPQVQPVQPVPVSTQPSILRFTLAANNLADKDIIGTSDPYVKVYLTQDGRAEELLKTSSKKNDDENPIWPDVFDFNYDPSKHPRLRFLILDEDDSRRDDELGNVSVEASDIFERKFVSTSLPKGTLSITRV